MTDNPATAAPAGPVSTNGVPGPIVLSTRIRLARNLAGVPFPGWAKEAQRRDILAVCAQALAQLPQMKRGSFLPTREMSDNQKQVLVEKHLISRELSGTKHAAGVYLNREEVISVMINEEDHLRLQILRPGLRFKSLWKGIADLDTALENHLDYAFHTNWGYLTACPTNLGTGLRASAMLHLPALVLSSHMDKVVRMVNHLGMAVRGLFGEGTEATGSIFQISNQQTLGESEEEIVRRLNNVLQAIIEQEQNARSKLVEDSPAKLYDKIGRAYGIVQNAHLLNSEETINLLSLLRLGVDLGLLPGECRATVDRFLIESQPGHIQQIAGATLASGERDHFRACHLRGVFRALPALQYPTIPTPETPSSN